MIDNIVGLCGNPSTNDAMGIGVLLEHEFLVFVFFGIGLM